jgi:hypothetical protein
MSINDSKKQTEVLRQICIYRQEHGVSPTLRELANLAKVSDVKSVYRMTKALEAAGLLEKESGIPRSIKLTDRGMEAIGLFAFPVKLEVPAPSLYSSVSIQYSGKQLDTNGTDADLREIIKSEMSAMGNQPTGTTLQGYNPKEIVIKSFTNAIYQLTSTEGYVTKFGSALLLLLLLWGSIAIVGVSLAAFVYPILLFYVIHTFHK